VTERLLLEPVRPEHAERLRELRRTPEVARWWNEAEEDWPLDEEADLHKLAVVAGGELVGYIQFWEDPDPTSRHADVDIFLGPGAQDRGLGTEAMKEVVRLLIEERGHHRITLGTSVDNARAIRVYEKVGFRKVGVLRKASRRDLSAEWEDEFLMELVV
jgi:aminoglycoside 6'-N-acetyltransferase